MPKQIFQRPAPVNHAKIARGKNTPGGAPDWGRKKGKSAMTTPKTNGHPSPFASTKKNQT